MTHRRALFSFVAACLMTFAFSGSSADARGALGHDQDACVLKVGPEFMYFSGYQPTSERRKFCEDIPTAGKAIFVFDFAQSEMRGMKVDFRIIRDVGEAENPAALGPITVAYQAPATYPSGTLNFEHAFPETGNFVGIVTVDGSNEEHWVARFPFSVGGAPTPKTPYILIGAALTLAVGLFVLSRRGRA